MKGTYVLYLIVSGIVFYIFYWLSNWCDTYGIHIHNWFFNYDYTPFSGFSQVFLILGVVLALTIAIFGALKSKNRSNNQTINSMS